MTTHASQKAIVITAWPQ